MTAPDSDPLDRDEQLGRLAEELQLAIAAAEDIEASRLAARYSVSEDEVLQLLVALRVMQESLDEDLDTNEATLAPPELSSDYEVGKELGRGGMGIVYRAHQKSLNRDVAVKVLRPGDLQFGDAIQRFEREARSLARLRHRHIVSVHEVGKASGFVYFTMDLIVGMSLQQLIAGGDMTNSRAVKLLRQVASAMTYAHSQGVVHRDLKPANILVDFEDDAFVVDFGLARDLGGSAEEVSAATMTGQMIGTPAYMSPEQALGDRDRIGEASDIYALGAVLYECLTGKRPFHGLPLAKLMHAVIETEPVAPRKVNPLVPEDLEVICQTAMQKRIEDRYPTVLAFAEDLERFSIGKEIRARRRSKTKRLLRYANQNRRSVLTAVVPAAMILLFAWIFWLPSVMRDREAALAEQLLADGNDQAALLAYRSAYGDQRPTTIDLAQRARFASCLINQAGRLQLGDTTDFEPERDRCLREAKQLLVEFSYNPHNPAMPWDATTRWAAAHEWNRLLAFSSNYNAATVLPRDELRARLQRDLDGPGQQAALVFIANHLTEVGGFASPLDQALGQALLEVIRKRHKLPAQLIERVDGFLREGSHHRIVSHRDPQFEQGLIDIVKDTRLNLEARTGAAALFHSLGVMPFAYHYVTGTSGGSKWRHPYVDAAALDRLVENWESLQGLDRQARYRKRVECVADERFRTQPEPPNASKSSAGWALDRWLGQRTGVNITDAFDWQDWWQEHKSEPPRTWLLHALNWDIELAALTPEIIVERFHDDTDNNVPHRHRLLHNLLALTVDPALRAPSDNSFGDGGDLVVWWERALNLVPNPQHHLRLATIAFTNGNPTPNLIWQKRIPLQLEQSVQWQDWISPDLQQTGVIIEYGTRRWPQHAGATAYHAGNANLTWQRKGVEGHVSFTMHAMHPTISDSSSFNTSSRLSVGMVSSVGWSLGRSSDGQAYLETIGIAFLEPSDFEAPEWNLQDWRTALGQTLKVLASAPLDYNHAPACCGIANMLALPNCQQSLRRIEAALRHHSESSAAVAHRAMLYAGDEAALNIDYSSKPDSWMRSPTYWLRLALATHSDTIRQYAFEHLQHEPLPPAVARTLLAARKTGLTVPDRLLARKELQPSQVQSLFSASWTTLGWLAATLITLLITGASMFLCRRGRSIRFAGLFSFAALFLTSYSIWIDGTEWNPSWFGFGLITFVSWCVCWRLVPGWGWIVPPLWWSITLVRNLQGQAETGFFFAGVIGVVLFGLLAGKHEAHDKRRRLRDQTLSPN